MSSFYLLSLSSVKCMSFICLPAIAYTLKIDCSINPVLRFIENYQCGTLEQNNSSWRVWIFTQNKMTGNFFLLVFVFPTEKFPAQFILHDKFSVIASTCANLTRTSRILYFILGHSFCEGGEAWRCSKSSWNLPPSTASFTSPRRRTGSWGSSGSPSSSAPSQLPSSSSPTRT